MVVSINGRAPTVTPKYYQPHDREPHKDSPNAGIGKTHRDCQGTLTRALSG